MSRFNKRRLDRIEEKFRERTNFHGLVAFYDRNRDRYHINGAVMDPDEFQANYADQPNLKILGYPHIDADNWNDLVSMHQKQIENHFSVMRQEDNYVGLESGRQFIENLNEQMRIEIKKRQAKNHGN